MRRRLYVLDGECVVEEVSSSLGSFDPSKAVQASRDECDINVIVKRFGLTGVFPVGLKVPTYQNFLDAPDDYRGALHAVREADSAFAKLPAAVRVRFDNDPAEFVAFCSDPANLPEMKKMGLAIDIPKESGTIVPKPGEGSPA